jgi:hypothetical protein
MLRKRINKSGFEALDAAIQALYKKAEGSDNYVLDVEDDDGTELKKAKDREKQRADKAEREAREAREALEALQDAQARREDGSLDKDAVERLKTKHAKELKDAQDRLQSKETALSELLVDSAATTLASDLFIAPEFHVDLVKKRLKLIEEDGKPIVKVLDADGNITENKIEDLRQEFVANEKFAPIIVASKASGGGANGGNRGGGAPTKKLSEMSATEEAAFANENPDAYAQMISEG